MAFLLPARPLPRYVFLRSVLCDEGPLLRNPAHEGVMVEIKAQEKIEDVAVIQSLSYLKASGFEVGLLINFGDKSLEIKRLINTQSK